MDELSRFEELVIRALFNVDQSYYATTIYNIQNFRNAVQLTAALERRLGRFAGNNFERFGERVFCYELYHQLRMLIDTERSTNQTYLQGTLLQGEVEKMQILELIQHFGLSLMRGEFAPDFLMHSPGNANAHPFVIEVKCENEVSDIKALVDIKKLNEFVTKFNYQRGLFITVNSDPGYMDGLLARISDQTANLPGRDRIKVICKSTQQSKEQIWQL